jgi:hypothetical protein
LRGLDPRIHAFAPDGEGVDGRDEPGQDETKGANFLLYAAARFSPDTLARKRESRVTSSPLAAYSSKGQTLGPAFAGTTAGASRPLGESGCFCRGGSDLSATDISSSAEILGR